MKEQTIRHCPFCGSDEEVRISFHGAYGIHCICGASLFGFNTADEAIKKWNTRRWGK